MPIDSSPHSTETLASCTAKVCCIPIEQFSQYNPQLLSSSLRLLWSTFNHLQLSKSGEGQYINRAIEALDHARRLHEIWEASRRIVQNQEVRKFIDRIPRRFPDAPIEVPDRVLAHLEDAKLRVSAAITALRVYRKRVAADAEAAALAEAEAAALAKELRLCDAHGVDVPAIQLAVADLVHRPPNTSAQEYMDIIKKASDLSRGWPAIYASAVLQAQNRGP